MKLSKREKVMVTLLLLVLLWAVIIRFVLVPMYTALENKHYEILELEERKQEMDLYLERFGGLEDVLTEEREKAENHTYFLKDINDIYVDRDIHAVAAKNQLGLLGVVINPPELVGDDEKKDGDKAQDQETEAAKEDDSVKVYVIRCTATVVGDKGNIMSMAEDFYQRDQSVVVTGMHAEMEYSNDGNGNAIALGLRGTMDVEYYYLEGTQEWETHEAE